MLTNQSPWLHQLQRTRPVADLTSDSTTDVAIIGGGIAGIATAYYTLKNTKKRVVIVEAGKIAHGATGHNGGFLATYFERSFQSIVQEFGLSMAAEGQAAIESSWELLEEIRVAAGLQTPLWQFTGYAGCANLQEVLNHLRNNALRRKAGLSFAVMMIAKTAALLRDIPAAYSDLYTVVEQEDINELLETDDQDYIAVLPERKGCMNSALFCEELIGYLLVTYPERFTLAEHAPVRRLVLKESYAVLDIQKQYKIIANQVVLCTNGFENITIVNTAGKAINERFHHLVRGIVGYMAGYTEDPGKPPVEISYLPKSQRKVDDIYTEDPYFYLTRRPFLSESGEEKSLICIGGPESLMDDTNNYRLEHVYPDEARVDIDGFVRYTYKHGPKDHVNYRFLWHGLMGFTPNGIRLVGPEPLNPILFYNLGCNGVGLLPSIFGGYKISRHLSGEYVPPSIFDPTDSRYTKKPQELIPKKLKQ